MHYDVGWYRLHLNEDNDAVVINLEDESNTGKSLKDFLSTLNFKGIGPKIQIMSFIPVRFKVIDRVIKSKSLQQIMKEAMGGKKTSEDVYKEDTLDSFILTEEGFFHIEEETFICTLREALLKYWWKQYKVWSDEFLFHDVRTAFMMGKCYLLYTDDYGLALHDPTGKIITTFKELCDTSAIPLSPSVKDITYTFTKNEIIALKDTTLRNTYEYSDDLAAKILFNIIEIKNAYKKAAELYNSFIVNSDKY
jgi:hypothetical protein